MKQLIRKAGLTQEEFADKLNVSRQTVNNWCAGRFKPRANQLKAISEILKADISNFI